MEEYKPNMLPCIVNKCLKFPMCKSKTIIYCNELFNADTTNVYKTIKIKHRSRYMTNSFYFPDVLSKLFPNLLFLYPDKFLPDRVKK